MQRPHLPHLHYTQKEWNTFDNRYTHSCLPSVDKILKNFPKPVWSGQDTKQDWKKIFHKRCRPGSPSFWIIYWRISDAQKVSSGPLKCPTFQRATRNSTLGWPPEHHAVTKPHLPRKVLGSMLLSLASFEYEWVFKTASVFFREAAGWFRGWEILDLVFMDLGTQNKNDEGTHWYLIWKILVCIDPWHLYDEKNNIPVKCCSAEQTREKKTFLKTPKSDTV